jgi:hypothetical protein
MRSCPTTQAYIARRTAQGKTPKEIRRCLKRYIARQLYRNPDHRHDPHNRGQLTDHDRGNAHRNLLTSIAPLYVK